MLCRSHHSSRVCSCCCSLEKILKETKQHVYTEVEVSQMIKKKGLDVKKVSNISEARLKRLLRVDALEREANPRHQREIAQLKREIAELDEEAQLRSARNKREKERLRIINEKVKVRKTGGGEGGATQRLC